MRIECRYENKILEELKGIPAVRLPAVLKFIHLLKNEFLFTPTTKVKQANALLDVDDFAIETGITDLAKNHDYYLYGGER